MSITSWHGWGQRGKVARAGWASGADDGKATRTPAAWMLAPLIWISFANLFPPWATSNQHKWIILAECRGEDEYFIKRKLYPNVDFYSGIIYQAMGFKPEMFTVLFAIPRTAGWLAQWQEMLEDPEQKIARPRQIYTGHALREFLAMEKRSAAPVSVKA